MEPPQIELDLVRRVTELVPPKSPTMDQMTSWAADTANDHGRELWAITREGLAYWSPDRLETEALRRASDGGDSLLGVFVSRLMNSYIEWTVALHALEANFVDPGSRAQGTGRTVLGSTYLRARLKECLDILERRAMSVDVRALDLRLRWDHQKLIAELFGRQLRSELVEAIRAANREDESSFVAIASRLDALDSWSPTLKRIDSEVQFLAEQATTALSRELLKTPAVAGMKRIGGIAVSALGKAAVAAVIDQVSGR